MISSLIYDRYLNLLSRFSSTRECASISGLRIKRQRFIGAIMRTVHDDDNAIIRGF